jgi:Rrf2 family protein
MNASCEYALVLLAEAAKRHEIGGFAAGAKIARESGLRIHFMRLVASDLIKAGILTSYRGAHGGYRLAKSPKEISLFDVSSLFRSKPRQARAESAGVLAKIREELDASRNAQLAYLQGRTLADLVSVEAEESDVRNGAME